MNKKGQAVVELVLAMGFFLTLFLGFIEVSGPNLIQLKAAGVARFGALLRGQTPLSEEEIGAEMSRYIQRLPGINPGAWQVRQGRYRERPAARFYQLVLTEVTVAAEKGPSTIHESAVVQQGGRP